MSQPNTPLARPLILGTRGRDVIAVKRALSRAGYLTWTSFTNVYGPYMRIAVHNFQHDHGLAPAGYGQRTHLALEKAHKKGSTTEWAWDSYSIQLMHEVYITLHISPENTIRAAIMQAARNLYSHRMQIAYSQARPFPLYKMGGPIPHGLDCSAYATDCYYAAGARNPNNRPYDGEGYTGTLVDGGTKVTRDKLKPGDLIMYGFTKSPSPAFPYGSPTHVAVYAGDGTVYSNGAYPMGHFSVYFGMAINCYVTYNVVP